MFTTISSHLSFSLRRLSVAKEFGAPLSQFLFYYRDMLLYYTELNLDSYLFISFLLNQMSPFQK